jgi:ABC-2 type transport system permease protein
MNTVAPEAGFMVAGTSMPKGRVFRSYLVEAKYTFLSTLRIPAFSIPMLGLPIFLYLLLGVGIFGSQAGDDPKTAVYLFSGFLVFVISGPGLFGFGVSLAVERQYGLLNLKRAQPMPPAAYLMAKMIMAMACTAIVILLLIPLAVGLGHMQVTAGQIANLVLVSMFGVLPFCAIGFLIGTLVSGSAAPGIVNLIFFPMLYLSGMFFPLPEILKPWALLWPTFYLNQIAWSAAGVESIINVKICIALLLGITVLFTGLAVRRLARVG